MFAANSKTRQSRSSLLDRSKSHAQRHSVQPTGRAGIIQRLQRQLGNKATQHLLQRNAPSAIGQHPESDGPKAKQFLKGETAPRAATFRQPPSGGSSGSTGPATVHPTGIANTAVSGPDPNLGPTYYGSIFSHTLSTSGGTITADITIGELVRVTRDDFNTGFGGVPLGTLTWGPGGTANIDGNMIDDRIGTGSIDVTNFVPGPPGLPAVMETPQELHYKVGTGSWAKFADVPMTVTLRAMVGGPFRYNYEVETNVNGVPSIQEYTGPE